MLPLPFVQIETDTQPTLAVIWLHGLGADGYDFVPIVKELEQLGVKGVRYVFPHAPSIPVSINGGYVMPAWYDIKNVDLQRVEDEAGIRQSAALVEQFIEHQVARGIPASRIVLAGFSQGGAITYQVGLRGKHTLAGLMCLSTYLPLANTLQAEHNTNSTSVPVFAAHGTQDDIVGVDRGDLACKHIRALGMQLTWKTYPMAHSVCAQEVEDIAEFLRKLISK